MARRNIYDVRYRFDQAFIYDKTPIRAGSTTATNPGNEPATVLVSMGYVDEKSYSFNSNSSTTDGVPTTFRAGIPTIEGDSIQLGNEITISPFEWGKTTTNTGPAEASGSVSVPANCVATISYVGTKGKCHVPFSYTQQDTSASGTVVLSQKSDGVFTGSNSYNFGFTVENVIPRT